MFIISFSQLFLYDHSQGVIIIFLLSTSCPEVEIYGEKRRFVTIKLLELIDISYLWIYFRKIFIFNHLNI